ncbi:MAG: 1-deoxy-D-xylulose 5-phosphate reductoisomerase [Rhodothermaceae bacterium]|nr:MAG: 1-deoxy-D-xylulose 5-phosphate reductoisomerase [Rhodothermaceae bacterium]
MTVLERNGPGQGLCVLGATGSIGTQALDVVDLFPDRLHVRALTAHARVDQLAHLARRYRPACVAIADVTRYGALKEALAGTGIEVLAGAEGLCEAATRADVDTVLAAVVGFAGLAPTLAAVRAGKKIALANKETLVVAGELVTALAARHGATLLPVDSEHSAIFQCLVGEPAEAIETLILTASGGPFRTRPRHTFEAITREEALRHPNWDMGAKITIDSATMMNKGLEVIEARWIFGIERERLRVLVHPQSIIHSMVVFRDGSTKAQLGVPDMKVPIQYALTYPERWPAPHPRVDWAALGRLDFEEPDLERFPCLRLAFEALAHGGTAPAVLNAANEQAVDLFLRDRIRFVDIPHLIEQALVDLAASRPARSLEELVETDARARRHVQELHRRTVH